MFKQIEGGDAPSSNGGNGGGGGNGLTGLTNILSQIDLPGLLRGVNSFVKLVGVFCPPLSQVIIKIKIAIICLIYLYSLCILYFQ